MLEAIGIGDLHLTDDKGSGGLSKYIEKPDAYVISEVSRCLKWGLEKGISVVFFYGDVCESQRMSYAAITSLVSLLRSKLGRKFQFFIILGNHDKMAAASSEGHSLEILMLFNLPNVHIITEDSVVDIEGVKVNFLPWPSTNFNPKLLNVAHHEVKGSKSDSGRVMDSDELPTSKAVAVIGHLHTAHKVRNSHFSGTLYQTNFGESLPKYFHHIQFKSPSDYEIELVPFVPKYTLHVVVAASDKDIADIPNDPFKLVKLIIQEGANVTITDYPPNVVIVKAFKTKHELVAILSEDLAAGEALDIKTSVIFKKWLTNQGFKKKMQRQIVQVRKRVLGGSK